MGRTILCALVLFVATQLIACSQPYKITTVAGEVYYAQDRPEVDSHDQLSFTGPDGREMVLDRDDVKLMEESDIPADQQ
ncbi:YgdI/YgdR family lipoprotein [Desulfotalea psychrophila]|uniref:YgdI/YgdR family lipoprotein n=1 Tax=Desulfotalea psychrophila TaxID=84980 RepID=UPI0002DD4B55|nr:YgdI/YgdR family lipoprotein [Desulfotalea psychrophila]